MKDMTKFSLPAIAPLHDDELSSLIRRANNYPSYGDGYITITRNQLISMTKELAYRRAAMTSEVLEEADGR